MLARLGHLKSFLSFPTCNIFVTFYPRAEDTKAKMISWQTGHKVASKLHPFCLSLWDWFKVRFDVVARNEIFSLTNSAEEFMADRKFHGKKLLTNFQKRHMSLSFQLHIVFKNFLDNLFYRTQTSWIQIGIRFKKSFRLVLKLKSLKHLDTFVLSVSFWVQRK